MLKSIEVLISEPIIFLSKASCPRKSMICVEFLSLQTSYYQFHDNINHTYHYDLYDGMSFEQLIAINKII